MYGWNPAVRGYDPVSGVVIVRASRETHRMVWAALTFMSSFKKLVVSANVRAVAGD
ncbi:unnamed protein product [Phaeothamnion confervicola]